MAAAKDLHARAARSNLFIKIPGTPEGLPAITEAIAADTLYVHGLAAPFTVNTMPDSTLEAFFDHGEVGDPLPADGGDADALLGRFTQAGVDLGEVAARLQRDGAKSFVTDWNQLLDRIKAQTSAVT